MAARVARSWVNYFINPCWHLMSTFLSMTLEVLFWRISSIISQGIGTEVNKPEVPQSFLLTIPEDMNSIYFPNSHNNFKIIKSPHMASASSISTHRCSTSYLMNLHMTRSFNCSPTWLSSLQYKSSVHQTFTLAAGVWDSWKPFLLVQTETKAALSILDFSKIICHKLSCPSQ